MHILLAEDDPMLGEALCGGLRHLGYSMAWVRDGLAAAQALQSNTDHFDALLLDLGLPRLDGLDLLGELRRAGSELPVLVLTARDTLEDRITGLDLGADDYLVKPFDLLEVAARVRAITRRCSGHRLPVLEHGPLRLDPAAHFVTWKGEEVCLSDFEFRLLEALLCHRGRVVSRAQLQKQLYGWGQGSTSNVLEVCVHNLRKKFGGELIRTVRGVGYTVPVTATEDD